ncbi:class I SAM-dependent methyltransferase [Aeromicrobium sp. CTD01-1L150]|uniref:class I SAM-dependent methyltransferase n=1 Tax=Aeromicrobium sp. CTD01-1L150 TaxID=3341830 RepID=UPI0035BF4E57
MTAEAARPGPSTSDLVQQWERQQSAYIAQRETRFEVMLDVIALAVDEPVRVLDLACGPGSTSERVLTRFPDAHVVAVDLDPALLALAQEHLARFGERVTTVDVDLSGDWVPVLQDAAGHQPFDAVVSTTALHWLLPHQLVRLYRTVHDLIAPGGVLLNGDHFRFDDRHPVARDWSGRHDEATQRAAFEAGAWPWDQWWAAVREHPVAGPLLPERERRFAGRDATPPTSVDFQLSALSNAGFAEVGTVWQLFDDYVVHGVRR